MTQPVYTQADCAFYNDGTESGSTLISGGNIVVGNTGVEDKGFDTTILFRAVIQLTAKSESNNFDLLVQKNGTGGYDTRANITGITAVDSTNLTAGDDTTQRLGSGTFITDNNGVGDNTTTTSASLTLNQELEVLFSFEIDEADVSDGDYFDFRVYVDGGSTALNVYSETLRVTVDKLLATVNQYSFRVRTEDNVSLASTTWDAAAGVDVNQPYGHTFRIRFGVEETSGTSFTGTLKLQHNKNTTGWSDAVGYDLTNPLDSSSPVWCPQSDQFAHGDAITTSQVSGSSETFTNGHGVEDTSGAVTTNSITIANQFTELEFIIRIPKIYDGPNYNAVNDTFDFRLVESDGTLLSGTYDNPRITIENNVGHIGGCPAESQGKGWPFKDTNGALYYATEVSEIDNEIIMMKSTDGGDTWNAVDDAGRPGWTDLESLDISQDGDTLHIIREEGAAIDYVQFYTSDHATTPDEWGTSENVATGYSNTDQSGAVVHRDDGTVIAFYRKTVTNEGIYYKIRSTGGVWGSENEIDTEASTEFTAVMAIKGSDSDWVHVFYKDDTNGDINHRSINPSDDSLTAVEVVYNDAYTGGSGQQWAMTNPIVWDDGTDDYVMIGIQDDSDGYLYTVLITNDGTPAAAQQVDTVIVESDTGGSTSRQPTATLAVDPATETVYCLFVDDTTSDVWRYEWTSAGGWGTATEVHDNSDDDEIRANVFTHSSGNGGATVLGYVRAYIYGGFTDFVRYDEYVISEATASGVAFRRIVWF